MKKILYATALGVLALFLSACGGEEPEAVQPDSYSMTEDYVLSLQVGNTTGLLSGVLEDESQVRGVEVTLSAPPVVVEWISAQRSTTRSSGSVITRMRMIGCACSGGHPTSSPRTLWGLT